VAAHDRVLALAAVPVGTSTASTPTDGPSGASHSAGRRLADQVPLVLIMIVYTMVGLYLLVIA